MTSIGQQIDKRQLYGSWQSISGEPGRTINRSDGLEMSLPPVTYSITTLNLKRFGSAVETTKSFQGMGLDSKYRGVWKIENDTLTVSLPSYQKKYLVAFSEFGGSLKSLTSNIILSKNHD